MNARAKKASPVEYLPWLPGTLRPVAASQYWRTAPSSSVCIAMNRDSRWARPSQRVSPVAWRRCSSATTSRALAPTFACSPGGASAAHPSRRTRLRRAQARPASALAVWPVR